MSEKKWYQTKEMWDLQRAWYEKLKDEGFYDVEGGVEGHYLKGATPSMRLGFLKSELDRAPWRKVDEVIDDSHEIVDYVNSSKARYYHFAQLITSQAFRDLEDPEMCLVWAFHAQGQGERAIAAALSIPRNRIRKYIRVLQRSIEPALDARVKECNRVTEQEEQ